MAYVATFDRIGRNHDVEPLNVAGDADAIAEQVFKYAYPKLMSRDVNVVVDLEQREATIFAGFHVAGRATLTELADA